MRQAQPRRRTYQFTAVAGPLPPLEPYRRCPCGRCAECRSNEKWDRIFAKFEVKDYEERSQVGSPLNDL
jgi:hypothetical protein